MNMEVLFMGNEFWHVVLPHCIIPGFFVLENWFQ